MPKESVTANTRMPGFLVLNNGAEILSSVWAWEITAITKSPKNGRTQLVFRGGENWFLETSVSVADAMDAQRTAMALYDATDPSEKLRRPKRKTDGLTVDALASEIRHS